MAIEIHSAGPDEIAALLTPISTALGFSVQPERVALAATIPELDLRLLAREHGAVVGATGSYGFRMTVPGGAAVPIGGLTVVGVLATHRRQGILTQLMRRVFDELRGRGVALSALFASEGTIYGRFGYGVASLAAEIDIDRPRAAFPGPEAPARARFVTQEEAAEVFPAIFDRVRATRPGMLSRSRAWWHVRRLGDHEWQRAGRGVLQRVVLEMEGRPAAYALYRYTLATDNMALDGSLDVIEAIGDSPAATRAVWRFLGDLDLVHRIKGSFLPVDHALFSLVAEPRRLRAHLSDALWVRLVDVGAALAARTYGAGSPLTLEVADAFCPWNEGRFRLEAGAVRRTDEPADLALDAAALGSAYLGAFSFTQLADAGRVTELREGALRRADALFRADRAPWCPDMF